MNKAEAPPAVPPPRPLDVEVLTLAELVDVFGVKRVTVDQWVQRRRLTSDANAFPKEDDQIGAFKVWRLERILAWAKHTGRPVHLDVWRGKKASDGYAQTRSKS